MTSNVIVDQVGVAQGDAKRTSLIFSNPTTCGLERFVFITFSMFHRTATASICKDVNSELLSALSVVSD